MITFCPPPPIERPLNEPVACLSSSWHQSIACPPARHTFHAWQVVKPGGKQDKWIAQLWLRESRYTPTVPEGNRHADAEFGVAEYTRAWRGSSSA